MTDFDRLPLTDRGLAALRAAVFGNHWACIPRSPFVRMGACTPRYALDYAQYACSPQFTGPGHAAEVASIYSYNTHVHELPAGLLDLMPASRPYPASDSTRYRYLTVRVRWFWQPNVGNGSELGRPNVYGIAYQYDSDAVVLLEYGCPHEMVTSVIGNCYRRTTCTRCGYTYHVDSGD